LRFRYVPCEFGLSRKLSFTQKSILFFLLRRSVQGTLRVFSTQWWKVCARMQVRYTYCFIKVLSGEIFASNEAVSSSKQRRQF
jgi:hypothetical protein